MRQTCHISIGRPIQTLRVGEFGFQFDVPGEHGFQGLDKLVLDFRLYRRLSGRIRDLARGSAIAREKSGRVFKGGNAGELVDNGLRAAACHGVAGIAERPAALYCRFRIGRALLIAFELPEFAEISAN